MNADTGLLLVNLGTPDAPTPPKVRAFLREFLDDPYVISLPTVLRRLLLYGIILPFRPRRVSEAYASIWTPEGSPLLSIGRELTEKTQALTEGPVRLGMRYGNPGINQALAELATHNLKRIVVLPLYPQYAEATTKTTEEAVRRSAKTLRIEADLAFVKPFYDSDAYLEPQAEVIERALGASGADFVLFTYHGLPEKQVRSVHPETCLNNDCCKDIREDNRYCYRAQCFETSRRLAQRLDLQNNSSTSFQSRLGPVRWIGPHTEDVLAALPGNGVTNLVVAAPSFAADCLETLEEIGIRGREMFLKAGGKSFTMAPCINAEPLWAHGVLTLALAADRMSH